jgi:nuclear pore complex protein Nup107
MSSGNAPVPSVLDSTASGVAESSGLGLVSALLEIPDLEGDARAREEAVEQRGRRWFPEGEQVSHGTWHGHASHTMRRRAETSQRIQQSLSQLDEVLTPLCSQVHHSHLTSFGATHDSQEATAFRVDLSHSPQGGMSMLSNAGVLQDLLLVPTPAHDTTHMPAHTRHSSLCGSLLLDKTVLGGEDSTMVENPTLKVGGDLIMAFHRELSAHSSPSQCLELVAALEKCCEVQWNILTDFEKHTKLAVDQLLSELRMEIATWQLLHVLGRDNVDERGRREDSETALLWREGASDKELADHFFAQDICVRQAQLVVDWLEGQAMVGLEQYPVKAAYFTDNVCWENTLHDLSHCIDRDLLVTQMDPDAYTRQCRKLSELDARDELSLNKHLFTCLRAGQLDKALSICVSSGQPLKAVMLGGWKLHHDPNMDMQYSDELGQVEGNDFRDIWKTSCWKMLDEPAYDVYEKAIFAALSGNVAKVLPACHTWYDHVWAYFKTLVDVQVEKVIVWCCLTACPATTGLISGPRHCAAE